MVSSWMSKSSIAVARNSAPATMSSTRFVSRPLIFWRWADVDSRSSWCSGSNSAREKLSWLSDRGTDSSRRAAIISARSSSVPLLPIAIFGSKRSTSTASGPRTSTRCSRSRRRSRLEIGSELTNCGAEPRDAEPLAHGPLQAGRVADHDLDAPAAEVEAQRRPGIDQHRGADRGEDEPGLLEPVDDVRADAGLRLDAIEDRVTVGGAAQRARRAGEDLGRARGFGQHPEPAHRLHRGVGGDRGDEALAAHDVAEPEHLLLAHERLERAVGAHFGHDEMEGVRSEVNRGDPHVEEAYAAP